MILKSIKIFPNEIRHTFGYLKKAGVNFRFVVLSVISSVAVAFLNLYAIALLFPLMSGIIGGDFTALVTRQPFRYFRGEFPVFFANQTALFASLVVWLYILTISKSVVAYVITLVIQKEGSKASMRVRLLIFDRYLQFGKAFYDQNNTARLVSQTVNCTAWIVNLLLGFQSLLCEFLKLVIYLSVMMFISWKLTVAMAVVFPLLSVFSRSALRNIRALSGPYETALGNLNAGLNQILTSLHLIQIYGQAERERRRFSDLSESEIRLLQEMLRRRGAIAPIQEISSTTCLLLVGLCLAFFVGRAVDSSRILVFFFVSSKIIPVLNSLGRFRVLVAEHAGAVALFDALMTDAEKYVVPSGAKAFPSRFERVEIKNLHFSYPRSQQVVKGVDFTIDCGKTLGIVGRTGAGKTTIANLLLRFYDCPANSIFIDGVDIREYNIDSLRSHIAYVTQDTPILDDTLRANVCYSLQSIPSDRELEPVLRAAQLYEFAAALPQKLDTLVGERGTKLSGGEKQRIAIARALLKNASILIFDEPTSALDSETEELITAATEETMRGKTVIIIAHRLSTIRNADSIVVIHEGKIIQSGTWKELTAVPGLFQQSWNALTTREQDSSCTCLEFSGLK